MDAVERHVRQRLTAPLPGVAAQWRFAPIPPLHNWAPNLTPPTARVAAALILLYPSADGPALPLTLRHRQLARHGGQVSLPGGAVNPAESPCDAALREAEEEIGVPAGDVHLLGSLSTLWVGVSNFLIHPFIGIARVTPRFTPHAHEVEALLEVPLTHVHDSQRLRWSVRDRGGSAIRVPYFDLGGHIVWGATAMILGEFACLFDPDLAPPHIS